MARRWQFVAYALAAASTTGGIGIGCSVLTSYEGYGGGDAVDPSCPNRRTIPKAPSAPAARGTRSLTGMMRSAKFLDLTKSPPASLPSFDLDGVCSTADNPRSASCANANVVADQVGTGGDNAIADNVSVLAGPDSSSFAALLDPRQDLIGDNCKRGRHGLAITITNYDGTPNDDKVTVNVINVVGLAGAGDGGAEAKFDGTDQLLIDKADLVGTTVTSKASDASAFVRDGVLYATFTDEFSIRLFAPSFDLATRKIVEFQTHIPLSYMRLVGKIDPTSTATGLVMKGATIAGRLPIASLFKSIYEYGLCPERGNFANIDKKVCNIADTLANGQTRPTQKCDAVSFAFQIDVAPAARLTEANARDAPAPAAPVCTSKLPTCD